jgi:hypothetical protein
MFLYIQVGIGFNRAAEGVWAQPEMALPSVRMRLPNR